MKQTANLLMLLMLSTLFFSCKKEQLQSEEEVSINTYPIKKIFAWLDAEKAKTLPDSAKLIDLLKESLLTEEISEEKLNNSQQLIIIPLKNNFKTINTTVLQTFKKLIITVANGEIVRGNIVELIPRGESKIKVNISAFINKQPAGFNGIASNLSIFGKFISEDVYKNGKLYTHTEIIKISKAKKISDSALVSTSNMSYTTCYNVYAIIGHYYNDILAYTTYEYIGSYCITDVPCELNRIITNTNSYFRDCGGGGGGDGGGGYGGGGGTIPPLVTSDVDKQFLTSACFIQFVNAIGDTKMKSEISKLYQNTFVGTGNIFNVTYKEQTGLKDPLGHPIAAKSHIDPNSSNTWVIELNSDWNTTGTKEAWGQAILHEVIHGFIKKNDLDFKSSSTWQQDHQTMLTSWINQTRDALMELYNMPAYDALALSFQGLDDVLKNLVDDTFKQNMRQWVLNTYNIDLVAAEAIVNQYFSGTKGSPCQ